MNTRVQDFTVFEITRRGGVVHSVFCSDDISDGLDERIEVFLDEFTRAGHEVIDSDVCVVPTDSPPLRGWVMYEEAAGIDDCQQGSNASLGDMDGGGVHMNPTSQSPDLMKVKHAATILRCSPKTLYRWIDLGYIPASTVVRFGGSIRLRREGILQLADCGFSDARGS